MQSGPGTDQLRKVGTKPRVARAKRQQLGESSTMAELPISNLPLVEEPRAGGEVEEIYADIRRTMEIPFVPNIHKAMAASPSALAGTWNVLRNVFLRTPLPSSVASMILFSIAAEKQCRYCSAVHQVTCKSLGVDEDTFAALNADLEALAPRRIQEIVKFAKKCAMTPQQLSEADYDAVRAQGVTDEELIGIIALAALGNYLDTLADATKIEVDSVFAEALSR